MTFSIRWALQRYWISTLLPTVVVWSIYADYSHTQEWKRQQKQKLEQGK